MDFKVLVKNNYSRLTKSQKIIAEYILNNFDEGVFLTAMQTGKKLNISETSVIRFAHTLGYDNYSSMSEAMRQDFLKDKRYIRESETQEPDGLGTITDYLKASVFGVKPEYSLIDFSEFKTIADLIMKSSKVLIMGYMDSFGISSELLHVLDMRREKVYFYRLLFEERNILYNMDEDSLIVTLSLSPHYRYSYVHTKAAKEGGCKVISITDSIINPYNDIADYSLVFNLKQDPADGLKDTSSIAKFIYYLGKYLNETYKTQIEDYRNSPNWRDEPFLE